MSSSDSTLIRTYIDARRAEAKAKARAKAVEPAVLAAVKAAGGVIRRGQARLHISQTTRFGYTPETRQLAELLKESQLYEREEGIAKAKHSPKLILTDPAK